MNAEIFLALFSLLTLSTGIFFIAKRTKIPYTVMLVLMGVTIGLLAQVPAIGDSVAFLTEARLTPDLLFYIFLPVLIFESAFNMNIRKMLDSAWTISVLAVIGMLLSTVLIAVGVYYILPLIGIEVPFIMALLFGAIISSTDPVAVLALFKEYGAPKRLTMIFEGESLFNDGTAVALFMVLLSVIAHGFHGGETISEGLIMFTGMVVFGIVFGLIAATLFSQALRIARSNEFVTVTLLIISAHLVFIISELINEHGLFGLKIHVSAIIATTVASLFLGNYSRHILTPATGEYLGKFIEHMAFVANSLVFILAGILFATSGVDIQHMWLPILTTVLIVAVVRFVAVMVTTTPLNALKVERDLPLSWRLLLSWGSLRGALAIILVLLVPENIAVDGWTADISPRDFLLSLTIGCILATLFIKAPLMNRIMKLLRINEPDPLELAHNADLGRYYLLTERNRFKRHKSRGFVDSRYYNVLRKRLQARFEDATLERDNLRKKHGKTLFDRSLALIAISVESRILDHLYTNGEVDEPVYRRVKGKLNLQVEHAEYVKDESEVDPTVYTDRKDIFDALARRTQSLFERRPDPREQLEQQLQYYRAQMIMARKTIRILKEMQTTYKDPVFYETSFDRVMRRYEGYREAAAVKFEAISEENSEELSEYLGDLAARALNASGVRALSYLHTKGITSEDIEHDIEQYFAIAKR